MLYLILLGESIVFDKGKPSRMLSLHEETLRDPEEKLKKLLHSGRVIAGRPECGVFNECCTGTPKSRCGSGYIRGKATGSKILGWLGYRRNKEDLAISS